MKPRLSIFTIKNLSFQMKVLEHDTTDTTVYNTKIQFTSLIVNCLCLSHYNIISCHAKAITCTIDSRLRQNEIPAFKKYIILAWEPSVA